MVEIDKLIPGKTWVRVNEMFTTKRCHGTIVKVISLDGTDVPVCFEYDGVLLWARLDSLDYADPPRPDSPPTEPAPSVRVEYETKRMVKSVTFEVTLFREEIEIYLDTLPGRYQDVIREALEKDEST